MTKIVSFLSLLLLAHMAQPLYSQSIHLQGRVVDRQSRLPLAFATIRLYHQAIGTVSDSAGYFDLPLPADLEHPLLVCSSIGYANYLVNLDTLQTDYLDIRLQPVLVVLEPVVVYADNSKAPSPEKMVKKALARLARTCPPYQAPAHIRHYLMENDRYIKYYEAQLLINDTKGYGRKLNPLVRNEQIYRLQERQSLNMQSDLLAAYGIFGDFIDPFRFLLHNALKYKYDLKNHVFSKQDTLLADNRTAWLITARGRENPQKYADWYDLKFYLVPSATDSYDYDIIRFEINFKADSAVNYVDHHINSTFSIDMRQQGPYYQPARIEYMMWQNKRWSHCPEMSVRFTAYYEMDFGQANFNPSGKKSLPAVNHVYQPAYWRDKPLPKQLVKDLSEYIPLARQFAVQADKKQRALLQDTLQLLKLQEIIAAAKGKKDVFIQIWDDYHDLMPYQQPANWPVRPGMITLLIATLPDRNDWAFIVTGMNASFFTNLNLPYSWQKLPHMQGKKPPAWLLIHKDGQVSYSDKPFGKESPE